MTGTALAAILLLLSGVLLGVPVAVILAIVILLLEVVRSVWTRNGLPGLRSLRAPHRRDGPPLRRAPPPRPDDLGRGDPRDHRGLQPQEPAARLAQGRGRRE